MEVSRYRPLTIAWASLLAVLLCLATGVALDGSRRMNVVIGFAIAAGVGCLADRLTPRDRLFTKLREARPLPLGADDVSDPGREIFLVMAILLAVNLAVAAGAHVLFGDNTAGTLGVLSGGSIGFALGSVRDSRMLERWEADNGRLFSEGKPILNRKGGLYVEDPAAAPLDAW